MPHLALKIDVDTYRGTREGVPRLVRMLLKNQVNASFLFSLGPDHTGWALRRMFRPGFFKKVSRTSVLEHYGPKTLMFGVLLPGPDIGVECAKEMRAVGAAGFECGIHSWDHVLWHDNVRSRGAEWTTRIMQRAFDRYTNIFGQAPYTHGAAGWQMNQHAYAQLDAFNFAYASDGRAAPDRSGDYTEIRGGPHRIRLSDKVLSCVQLPTTLPTLDELLGRTIAGVTIDQANLAATVLKMTETPRDHVFTLHAELEGQKLAPIFEQLVRGWQSQGYNLGSMADYYQRIRNQALPVVPVAWGSVAGRSGELIVQSIS